MKKELFAALILIALAGLSIWNLGHAKALTDELSDLMLRSCELASEGLWDKALALAQQAGDIWSGSEGYTHIFIRHSEVDLTTDAFGDYLAELYGKDAAGATGALQKLLDHLESIYEMERITLKSVF